MPSILSPFILRQVCGVHLHTLSVFSERQDIQPGQEDQLQVMRGDGFTARPAVAVFQLIMGAGPHSRMCFRGRDVCKAGL